MPTFVLKAGRADEATQPDLLAWLGVSSRRGGPPISPAAAGSSSTRGPDHYFRAGFVPATPLALYFGGNVAPSVIEDIRAWIHSVASG